VALALSLTATLNVNGASGPSGVSGGDDPTTWPIDPLAGG
jgi:hypothetical protein